MQAKHDAMWARRIIEADKLAQCGSLRSVRKMIAHKDAIIAKLETENAELREQLGVEPHTPSAGTDKEESSTVRLPCM